MENRKLVESLLQSLGLSHSNYTEETECEAYAGFTIQSDRHNLKFRKAKITPKKIGQFVTLWKRDPTMVTTPYTTTDPFDFYIILTQHENQKGCFVFPRFLLGEKAILSTNKQEGKRGFRVYPVWDNPTSKQALHSQKWQIQYFINLNSNSAEILTQINSILEY